MEYLLRCSQCIAWWVVWIWAFDSVSSIDGHSSIVTMFVDTYNVSKFRIDGSWLSVIFSGIYRWRRCHWGTQIYQQTLAYYLWQYLSSECTSSIIGFLCVPYLLVVTSSGFCSCWPNWHFFCRVSLQNLCWDNMLSISVLIPSMRIQEAKKKAAGMYI